MLLSVRLVVALALFAVPSQALRDTAAFDDLPEVDALAVSPVAHSTVVAHAPGGVQPRAVGDSRPAGLEREGGLEVDLSGSQANRKAQQTSS